MNECQLLITLLGFPSFFYATLNGVIVVMIPLDYCERIIVTLDAVIVIRTAIIGVLHQFALHVEGLGLHEKCGSCEVYL